MKFAVAGNNATAIGVLRELVRSTEHTLVCCALSGELAAAVSRDTVPVMLTATVEDALLSGDVDAVIVAIDDQEESLRIVRAASAPRWTWQPATARRAVSGLPATSTMRARPEESRWVGSGIGGVFSRDECIVQPV